MESSAGDRRNEMDWIRLALAAASVLLTAARPFASGAWALRDPSAAAAVTRGAEALELAVAPLFCVVSGAAAAFALRRMDPAAFVVSKVLRLVVPFATGMLLVALLQRLPAPGASGVAYPWYLPVLFFSLLLLLPAFFALRSPSGRRLSALLASAPGAVWVPAAAGLIPAAACAVPGAGAPAVLSACGGWSPLFSLAMVGLGFLLFGDPGVAARVSRQRFPLGAAAAAAAAVLLLPPPRGDFLPACFPPSGA
jgi:hypothetical protein